MSATITTNAKANAIYTHGFDNGEGYGPGLSEDGMRQSVEDTVDDMLDDPASRLRSDLSGYGLTVVHCAGDVLVGLRDDAGEGAWAIVLIDEEAEDETEQEAGRRIDEERNERAGREINALAKLQRAGVDPATCSEEEAAAVEGVGPLMAANLCRQSRRLAALGYVPD